MRPKQCAGCEFYHHYSDGRDVIGLQCPKHQCWARTIANDEHGRYGWMYKMVSRVFPCSIFEECELANGGKGGRDKCAYGFIGDGLSDIQYRVTYSMERVE